ncbi:MAG: 16S rRNA (guanine(527)-N(7))-methyltransferase RsmG [Methylococcales bacterium]|jgi:16S rRNA (guanine527-N7)-methyltransferase|nr:16S rRNA (guanine(527)-N(7))-methyltransferase RsmG [Methylococcaceae bacterium]HIL41452.1 16S rRNA (guanine(527)-N(7))-methyltransferase RsmG [Methylococcales bacterium]
MQKCQEILNEGLNALDLLVTQAQQKKLIAFIALIEKWNKAYNLTAIRNPEQMVRLHLLDSLAIANYIQGPKVLDIGTGAGLPGIPLALIYPDYSFVLLDSNSKKTRFVQQAVIELGLKNVTVWHGRIEHYQPTIYFNSIVSRAFSSVQSFVSVASERLSSGGVLLAMKGRHPDKELQQIDNDFSVIPIMVPGVDAERCLVQLHKVKST